MEEVDNFVADLRGWEKRGGVGVEEGFTGALFWETLEAVEEEEEEDFEVVDFGVGGTTGFLFFKEREGEEGGLEVEASLFEICGVHCLQTNVTCNHKKLLKIVIEPKFKYI